MEEGKEEQDIDIYLWLYFNKKGYAEICSSYSLACSVVEAEIWEILLFLLDLDVCGWLNSLRTAISERDTSLALGLVGERVVVGGFVRNGPMGRESLRWEKAGKNKTGKRRCNCTWGKLEIVCYGGNCPVWYKGKVKVEEEVEEEEGEDNGRMVMEKRREDEGT